MSKNRSASSGRQPRTTVRTVLATTSAVKVTGPGEAEESVAGDPDRHRHEQRRAERLVEAIKAVLQDAIKAGGSSLRDHKRTNGELGLFQHNFRVYDREGEHCPTRGCSGIVKRIVQTGRSTFFCPVCQR